MFGHLQIERVGAGARTRVTALRGGDIEFGGGKIMQNDTSGERRTQCRKDLHASQTRVADGHYRVAALCFRDERPEPVMICSAAERTSEAARLPLAAAITAPEVAAAIDTADLRECRPAAAHRAVTF